ncbi:MAG: class I SAM-dependent methyltransferase [Chloroflexi bacterium]|nr:class I SAM-dependent methyltransferase [Chloroflexota bacterium]
MISPPHFDWHDPARVQEWLGDRLRGGNRTRVEQLEIVLELLAALQPDEHRILDLGCGDGLVDELFLSRFPRAYVVGIDSSAPMLDAARARLSPYHGRFTLRVADLRQTHELQLDGGPFDAVFGVQSVHHLSGVEKQQLFQWVGRATRDGGLLVLADRVKMDSAALFPFHQQLWDRLQRRDGTPRGTEGYDFATHLARCELRGDLPDTLDDQLAWMRAAGFGEVDIFYRQVERAVFGGLKQPARRETPALPPLHAAAEMRGI